MLIYKLLHSHEPAADPNHEYAVDDLGRDDLGAEEVLARIDSVYRDLYLVLLDELLEHLVHNIVVDARVFDALSERVCYRGGRLNG